MTAEGLYPGMKGGTKHKLLGERRQEVIRFYEDNGPQATMDRYNMRPATLDRFLRTKPETRKVFTAVERATEMAKMALDGNREARCQIRNMRREFNQLVPLVARDFAKIMVKALQRVELEDVEQGDDPLSLANFTGKLEK